jgi:hypothetical protein
VSNKIDLGISIDIRVNNRNGKVMRERITSLTHQVRIIDNFQRFFKYSKYGPISKIFFFKVPKSTKFSPPAKKAGRMHRQGASADRKRHSGEKNRHRWRGRITTLVGKLF